MRDYPLHPGLRTFWVDLQRERLKAIEPGGRIILDNPNDGRYEIPFSAISKYFQLDDPAIYKWTMYLTARATQPNFFTILSKKMLPDGRRENTVIVDDFDASKYFVSDLEKAKSNEEPEMLVFDTSQTKSAEAEIEAEIDTSSRFEMENELEGFLAQNWSTIFPEWEKMGRQVPAGDAGRMDFLGKHKTSGHFQVWELKRGESDDAALAQVLKYGGRRQVQSERRNHMPYSGRRSEACCESAGWKGNRIRISSEIQPEASRYTFLSSAALTRMADVFIKFLYKTW